MAKGKYKEWLEEDNLLLLKRWARNGLTDEQIAEKMGIATSTFYEWKNKYTEISEVLKKTKEIYDTEVEDSLYKLITGYEYEETVKEKIADGREMIRKVTKHVPPNVTAIIFWLKNRQPKDWRDRQDITLEKTIPVFKGEDSLED